MTMSIDRAVVEQTEQEPVVMDESWCLDPQPVNGLLSNEQAEQEPVAWMQDSIELYVKDRPDNWHTIPLYAAPVRTKDLTDDELNALWYGNTKGGWLGLFRAVIAADREKNK